MRERQSILPDRATGRATRHGLWLWLALPICAGCSPPRTPPPRQVFAGLPVSGALADAKRLGFTDCLNTTGVDLRCRRHGVMLMGHGPYEGAVDLVGSDGSGGFDQLILWHDRDQYAIYDIADMLEKQGWQHCNTGTDDRGDQAIYTRSGSPVWFSMDLSYWGKRRMRILPERSAKERGCAPGR